LLKASAVMKLLPNVVMSNLSIHLGMRGENAATSGTSIGSAWALAAALRVLEEGKVRCAVVGSASFPYEYFNLDAYLRFFGPEFLEPPLVEGASALLLRGEGDPLGVDPGSITGAVRRVELLAGDPLEPSWDGARSACFDRLRARGFDLDAYAVVGVQPSKTANFLAAGEPLGVLSVIHGLNESAPDGRGLSVSYDRFGNVSAVEVEGARRARRVP
jgi:hypothetical protein